MELALLLDMHGIESNLMDAFQVRITGLIVQYHVIRCNLLTYLYF